MTTCPKCNAAQCLSANHPGSDVNFLCGSRTSEWHSFLTGRDCMTRQRDQLLKVLDTLPQLPADWESDLLSAHDAFTEAYLKWDGERLELLARIKGGQS